MLGNCQCQGVLLLWVIVGQGPTVLAVSEGGGCSGVLVAPASGMSLKNSKTL